MTSVHQPQRRGPSQSTSSSSSSSSTEGASRRPSASTRQYTRVETTSGHGGDEPPDDRRRTNPRRDHEEDYGVGYEVTAEEQHVSSTPSAYPSRTYQSARREVDRSFLQSQPAEIATTRVIRAPVPRRSNSPSDGPSLVPISTMSSDRPCNVFLEEIVGPELDFTKRCPDPMCLRPASQHSRKPYTTIPRPRVGLKELSVLPLFHTEEVSGNSKIITDGQSFITALEQQMNFLNLELLERAQVLQMRMHSQVNNEWVLNSIVNRVIVNPSATWEWVKKQFLEHFGAKHDAEIAKLSLSHLHEYQQKEQEGITSYRTRFELLVRRALLKLDDQSIIEKFRVGLLPHYQQRLAELKSNLVIGGTDMTHRLNSMDQIVAAVREFEQNEVESAIIKQTREHGSSSSASSEPAPNVMSRAEQAIKKSKKTYRRALAVSDDSDSDTSTDTTKTPAKKQKSSTDGTSTDKKPILKASKKGTFPRCPYDGKTNHALENCMNKKRVDKLTSQLDKESPAINENDSDDVTVSTVQQSTTHELSVANTLNEADTSRTPSVNTSGQRPPEQAPPTSSTLKRERNQFSGRRVDPNVPEE